MNKFFKMNDILWLDIWKGDWGLPSVDISCLHVLAYAKFGGVPMRINATNNPFKTPSGQLPVLHTNVSTLDTIDSIIEFCREKKYDPDNELTPQQCAEITAYSTMLKEQLFPALQFVWWIDQKNVNEFIRPWYCKALPFPLHFYYPRKYEQQVKDMMEILYPLEDNLASIENKVYSEAQKCLTSLSTRLGNSEFFFGSHPTSLDAVIYSYLAPLLKAPLPNPALQNYLKACTNLVKFISRISQRYFENEYRQYEKLKSKENAQKPPTESEDDFPNKRRNQFLAGFFATTAMVTYALSTGILKVPIKDDELMDIPTDYLLDDQDVNEE